MTAETPTVALNVHTVALNVHTVALNVHPAAQMVVTLGGLIVMNLALAVIYNRSALYSAPFLSRQSSFSKHHLA
eukprot:494001-Prorocentrum_minimum.AAC.3